MIRAARWKRFSQTASSFPGKTLVRKPRLERRQFIGIKETHMKKYIVIAVLFAGITAIGGLAVKTLAETAGKEQVRQETPEERRTRMLRAFDAANYRGGIIGVSFAEDATKAEAVAFLRTRGLSLAQERVCGPEEAGPESESAQNAGCVSQDRWNERLKLAYVTVPAGREKEYAELLIQESLVAWVEPDMIMTAAGEPTGEEPMPGEQSPDESASGTSQGRFVGYAFLGILAIAAIAFVMRKKSGAVRG